MYSTHRSDVLCFVLSPKSKSLLSFRCKSALISALDPLLSFLDLNSKHHCFPAWPAPAHHKWTRSVPTFRKPFFIFTLWEQLFLSFEEHNVAPLWISFWCEPQQFGLYKGPFYLVHDASCTIFLLLVSWGLNARWQSNYKFLSPVGSFLLSLRSVKRRMQGLQCGSARPYTPCYSSSTFT